LAAITSIISWQVIGWPASNSTRTAASIALAFFTSGSFVFLGFVFVGAGVAAGVAACSTGVAV
jgi:hypothetical protein